MCFWRERADSPKPKPCVWTEVEHWESACGYAFIFNDDGPVDSNWKFCPKCGKPLIEKPYIEPVEDRS